jgi:plasmid stability protein
MRYGSCMSTITLKNVPPRIHRDLKTRAKTHGRSLNKEIITSLEQMLQDMPTPAAGIANQARAVRESMDVYLTQKDLTALKEAGRQ